MKFIGQFIQNLIARFRNDVYLESIQDGTVDSDKFLGLDSNNKIVKEAIPAGLSITNATDNLVVTSTGGTGLNAESGLQFTTFLRVNDTLGDVKVGAGNIPFGYNPDVINSPYGQIAFESAALSGTGLGALIEQSDLSSGSHTGAALGIKAGGSVGTDKFGGNLELIGGRGTGSGAGGSLRFWSAPSGSSGSSYNTSAVKFTIDSDGDVDITGSATVAGLIGATSGASMLGNSYLVFSNSDNSNTTRVRSSTTSTNRTIFFPDADGTLLLKDNVNPGKQFQVFQCNFIDDLNTSEVFIPIHGTTFEGAQVYQDDVAILAPCDGRIVSLDFKCISLTNNGDLTAKIYTLPPNTVGTSGGGTATTNWTEEESETISVTSTDDNHVFHFAFDNAKHFESTEMFALSIQASADVMSNTFMYATVVVEFDYSTLLGSTSAEFDSVP